MARSIALSTYLAFTARAETWGRRKLERRKADGKEDAERIGERRGEATVERPEGSVLWFHAASVGEALSLLEVLERLTEIDPALTILVTTGTVSSAEVMKSRLPPRCIHQFVPIDVRGFVRRFLDHWRPELAIFAESEFWPNLIMETTARGIPLLLVNARLSDTSTSRWGRTPAALSELLARFAAIQVQDDATAATLRRFGYPPEQMKIVGTLEEGAPPPPCDEAERARLAGLLKGRPVWLAASTHPGEEAIVTAAHRSALRASHRLLLVASPRHPERGAELAAAWRKEGWNVAQRSEGEVLTDDTQIYLADTLGEMGLWYRLAPISFVGGSLVPVGGHNPFEPAALGSAIITGPHVGNFRDIYARLKAAGGARFVSNESGLAAALTDLLRPDRSAPMAYAAWEICSSGADAADKALSLILDYLPGHSAADARTR